MEIWSDISNLYLFLSAVPIGVFAVVLGGSMFLSIPVFQIFFPEMSMSAVIGNIKVGSVIRNMGAVVVLKKHINYPYDRNPKGGRIIMEMTLSRFLPPVLEKKLSNVLFLEWFRKVRSYNSGNDFITFLHPVLVMEWFRIVEMDLVIILNLSRHFP